MSNAQAYDGLRRLAAKAGLLRSSASRTALAASDAVVDQPGGEPEDEPEVDPATPPAEPDPADAPEGAPEGEPAGEPEDEPEDPAADPAPVEANQRQPGYQAGVDATNGRWAATLLDPAARANLELATDLLASTDMAPSAIVGMCSRHRGASATARQLLETTPKVNLGHGGGGQQAAASEPGKQARAKATARVNARVGARGKKASKAAASAPRA